MHKVFISYHHDHDQGYKEGLSRFGEENDIFIDRSVDTGDIPDGLSDQRIREIIRDERLRDSTVTIVLVGTETRRRKHIDWEIYSSMYDGKINKKSGVIAISLPATGCNSIIASHGEVEKNLYPDDGPWFSVDSRAEYKRLFPHLPDRILDNLANPDAKISVLPWAKVDAKVLNFLIEAAFKARGSCRYDLSRRMRRANS